jgi:hypothetical protein
MKSWLAVLFLLGGCVRELPPESTTTDLAEPAGTDDSGSGGDDLGAGGDLNGAGGSDLGPGGMTDLAAWGSPDLAAGACVVDGVACNDGDPCTVGDTCVVGLCRGFPRVCNLPPAAACLSGTQLLTWDKVGTCQQGACVYAQKQITCGAGGCVANQCAADPCGATTCTTPPSLCFKSAGTCSAGQCSYGYDDGVTCNDGDPCTENDQCNTGLCKGKPKACLSPPANVCEDAVTLRIHDAVGTCGAGACSYSYHFVTCAAGCAAGRCKATPWTTLSSGVTVTLFNAWGASANDVFAVGEYGTIIRYNGVQWKTMAVPPIGHARGIDGTSATNVFVMADSAVQGTVKSTILRWDGQSWTKRGEINRSDFACVGAVGVDDAFAWTRGALYRVTGGSAQLVKSITVPVGLQHDCNVRARATNDVYLGGGFVYHYDGNQISELKEAGATHGAYSAGLAAFGPTQVLSFAYNAVHRFTGTQWLLVSPGIASVEAIGGSAWNRLFAVGDGVSFWDGSGWTGEMLPAGTPYLYGVWAATSGEVYAVGSNGTILKAIH